MARRLGRVRSAAAIAALAVVGAIPLAVPGASAAPVVPERAAQAADPATGALAPQPANTEWARQILRRLMDAHGVATPETSEVLGLARDLENPDVDHWIEVAALHRPQVDARVDDLFVQILGRHADPSGLAFWSRRIRETSLTYENLLVTLAISNEAWTKAGATPEGYVAWTFPHVLGRSPDPAGSAYWTAKLQAGTSRDRFVRSFLRSPERSRSVVRASFLRYLGRPVDASGLAYWSGRYAAARVGELDLAVMLLASNESRNDGCGYDPTMCLLPFPSSKQTVPDASTLTGQRVALKPEWMPANANGKHVNPVEWNRNDGFSPGQALLVRVPGIDLEQTGLAGIGDIGASLDEDAPVVIWDVEGDRRVPYWAELDAHVAAGSPQQLLIIHPAVNYEAGHTYLVGMKGMKGAAGQAIASPPAFEQERQLLLDDVEAWPDAEDQVEATFRAAKLQQDTGLTLEETYLSWQFTVASTENTTGRMLDIRDDALATIGNGAPAFTVAKVTPNPRAGVAKRVEGTFQVPLYLTGTGQPGAGFKTGLDGLPVRNGSYTADYDCEIPTTAAETPARPTVYGHGLFGDLGEVRSGPQAAMVTGHNMAYCATDWIGMAEPDVANAATILQDISSFGTLPDRTQQGILNTIFLGRLMSNDAGFVSNPAFQDGGGDPLLDTSALFYDGNSQGAVVGGAYLAVDPKVEAGVLGVAGMNYSTLLDRSVDFDPFFDLMKATYPNRRDQVVGLQLIQMLWDRGETNGYAAHLDTADPLPGTPAKRVLIHAALGDHQVSTVTAEVEARTAGIPIHRPVYQAGRDPWGDDAWGLDAISYPSSGSGLVLWDSGADLPPLGNVPPRTGEDPHGDPRNSAQAQQQKSEFLQTGGTLIDVCSGAPCTAPAT